jgi:mannobiose 2-epimerase
MDSSQLRVDIESELRDNLLPFWRDCSVDPGSGGFIAEMTCEGAVVRDAPRGLILAARLLWTFSALYRRFGDRRDLELASRAYYELETIFRDPLHGGYRWRADAAAMPLDETKKTYGQAFALYALSEYHLVAADEPSLAAARIVYELIEQHVRDPVHGGYFEAREADWRGGACEQRLGDDDMVAAKSMNAHLHLLEAYTALYRAWPNRRVAASLRELIDIFDRFILDRSDGPCHNHLHHFFDERWTRLSSSYTYGHDIEASWLLVEAAESLGDEVLRQRCREWAVAMAATTLSEGIDSDGCVAYAGRDGEIIDGKRDWWCQAEGVVGLWNAWQLTGDRGFAEVAQRLWGAVLRFFVDPVAGEWFWRVNPDGSVDQQMPKVSEWKGPYHNTRMCLEMMHRISVSSFEVKRWKSEISTFV